jgi:Mn-dependent DtxR family transcriptional regulator
MTVPSTLVLAARTVRSRIILAVLVELHESLSDSEHRKVPVSVVAHRLHTSERHVYWTVKKLEAMGYLERGPRLGGAGTFRLVNPSEPLQLAG